MNGWQDKTIKTAWATGLFEGEGTIYQRRNGGVKLRVSMTDKEVVEKFAGVFGMNVYKRCVAQAMNKEQWEACTESRDRVNKIVCAMQPFLSTRRQNQIERALGESLPEEWRAAS